MSDYFDMRRRAAQQASYGNYWAGKCVGLLGEIERLRAAIEEALGDLGGHRKADDAPWCGLCGAADGSWPCITRMVADDLNDALKGTTDDR